MVLVLLITAAAGFGSWWYAEGRFTTAPNVIEVSEAVAVEAAEANDLKVTTSTEYSEDVAAGLVISTDPGSNARVPRGETMELVISLGPERFAMPEVVGSSLGTAKEVLQSMNLALGEVKESWSEKVDSGVVISASEDAGVQLKRDTSIDLTVSKGPEPIVINDFTGESADKARKQLEEAGLRVKSSEENSPTVAKGLVISQDPSSGNGKSDDVITIVESLGPVMVEIPKVRYDSVEKATKTLESLGFEVEVKYVTDFPISLQIASGTEPAAGTSAAEGSKVILLVN